MRLIDADALTKVAGKLWNEMPDGEELSKELMKAINHAPTIDAVPVVRCRDCIAWRPHQFTGGQTGLCTFLHIAPGHDGFCAAGERREE